MGRRNEISEVKRVLSAARLLTLTGPGGVGKTRLALLEQTVADAMGLRDWSTRPARSVVMNPLGGQATASGAGQL